MTARSLMVWLRGLRARAQWAADERARNRRCGGFLRWMEEHHGPPMVWHGQRSWRVEGVLMTVWMEPMRLKVYHRDGKITYTYELTWEADREEAKQEVERVADARTAPSIRWLEKAAEGEEGHGQGAGKL